MQQRKKSTNSDSGVMSMDHAILESSDEHKPMVICDDPAGQPHRAEEKMDIAGSSLYSTEALHQNVNYFRNKPNRDNSISSKHSTPVHLSKQNSSQTRNASPEKMLEAKELDEARKKERNVFETPCHKRLVIYLFFLAILIQNT